jgi:hypothetical protein
MECNFQCDALVSLNGILSVTLWCLTHPQASELKEQLVDVEARLILAEEANLSQAREVGACVRVVSSPCACFSTGS